MEAEKFKPLLRNQISEIKHCLSLAKRDDDKRQLMYNLKKLYKMQQYDETTVQYNRRIKQMQYPDELQSAREYCLQFYENLRKVWLTHHYLTPPD